MAATALLPPKLPFQAPSGSPPEHAASNYQPAPGRDDNKSTIKGTQNCQEHRVNVEKPSGKEAPQTQDGAQDDESLSRVSQHSSALGIATVAASLTSFGLLPKSAIEHQTLLIIFCYSTLIMFLSGWFILLLSISHRPSRHVTICQSILLVTAALTMTVDIFVFCFPLLSLPAFLTLVALSGATVLIFGLTNYFTMTTKGAG